MKKARLVLLIALLMTSIIALACGAAPAAAPNPTSVPITPTNTTAPPVPPTDVPIGGGLSSEELAQLQEEFDANFVKWNQADLSHYRMEFRVICFCPESITNPVNITVNNSYAIESITYVESGSPVTEYLDVYLSVGGMFDMIQEALDMKVASLTVSYDPELGYPTDVFIDRDFMIADEERGFSVSSLEPIELPTREEIQSRLDANRQLWESNGPTSYEIEYRRGCFCGPNVTDPVVTVVNNGAIESRTYAESGEAVGEAVQDLFPDVPGLFQIIQDAIDQDAASITASYDSQSGYPVNLYIDYKEMMADEELGFSINSLK